jgi:hypothetical protein
VVIFAGTSVQLPAGSMHIPAAECRRRAEVLFELASATEDSFERLPLVLKALQFEARAKILEEEASRATSDSAI